MSIQRTVHADSVNSLTDALAFVMQHLDQFPRPTVHIYPTLGTDGFEVSVGGIVKETAQ